MPTGQHEGGDPVGQAEEPEHLGQGHGADIGTGEVNDADSCGEEPTEAEQATLAGGLIGRKRHAELGR